MIGRNLYMNCVKYADEIQANVYKNFPSTHILSNSKTVDNIMQWTTFFRRNLNRYAKDYYGFKLHFYQDIILYFLGICQLLVIIACRAAAKSFIIAMFAVCYCGTHPNGEVVLTAKRKKQAREMVTKKIQNELMSRSVNLRNEIKEIKDNQGEICVIFYNNARITVIIANDDSRGARSNVAVREEFRQIAESVENGVIKQFQIIRQTPYLSLDFYKNIEILKEQPVDIYISSSWLDNGHWMWKIVDNAYDCMMKGENKYLFAFDLAIPLAFNIKTKEQLLSDKRLTDSLSWRIEYENERVKENETAFFTYKMLMDNRRLKKPFYPLMKNQIQPKQINSLHKQTGEIRIVSCDMAFITRKGNDNSVFSCIRALPETKITNGRVVEKGYRRQVCYLEHKQGGDLFKQARRIRQIYEDFNADYIVLDVRNGGLSILEHLQRCMYDEERDVEYNPITCMNDEGLSNRIQIEGAEPVIFAVAASEKLNDAIARNFRIALMANKIDFLIDLTQAKEEIIPKIYKSFGKLENIDASVEFYIENPFLETQLLITETAELVYEKKIATDRIVIHEQGGKTKDRYTSVSYGSYFIDLLEKDNLTDNNEDDIFTYQPCTSSIDFD